MTGKRVAVVGATGVVGRQLLETLDARDFPISSIRLLASERSEGKELEFRGEDFKVEVLREDSFKNIDIALFSAGGDTSKHFAPFAAKEGCVVIDNSSAWRMDPNVPLIVPEVNPDEVHKHQGIIANPNCSTIQMVVALKPIHDAAGIERIVVSTYQAVSGAGIKAYEELHADSMAILNGTSPSPSIFPKTIAFNCIPQIPSGDLFEADGYSTEEIKMVNETQKIMGDDSIKVTATTVRVPVFTGHSESVNVQTRDKLSVARVRELLSNAPGVVVLDDREKEIYPTARDCEARQEVYVGRIREDLSHPRALNLWIVSDNLLKGAAYNAVQIAELLQ